MSATTDRPTERPRVRNTEIRDAPGAGDVVLAVLGMAAVLATATVPLTPSGQAIFALCTIVAFTVANRFRSKPVTLFLVALSVAVSLRYLFFRVTQTLSFENPVEWVLGIGLVLAETYAIVALTLGYVQTAWPLGRTPLPLPDDASDWPVVDVFIPTLDEPLEVVRATVLAALAIDWPADRLLVWLLDDGRRAEFSRFADTVGCGYLARAEHRHAKAGNLNHALDRTGGEYVAVFDCDHIPTRAFLQVTLGWLAAEPNLAFVQTPQHHYSPDPFQRNLLAGGRVPPEGNLFHGLAQDGNDHWNAAMFSGSGAVLRRTALDDVGGFATGTVTEDAHTSLRLHRRGWDSAYLGIPLAAGRAPERLASHIAQRARWARGMLQIFRTDNPLLGRGLSFGQRVCYLQATAHFLFPLPRLAFLTAPLAFLLCGQTVIAAAPLAITAYAVPHLFHAVATTSRIDRRWRHSFWGEVYETVAALFLVPVVAQALVAPRRGAFAVTAKGGVLERGVFDFRAVYPNVILALLLVAGIVAGAIGMVGDADPPAFYPLLLNTIWAAFSLLIVAAALAVGRERPLRAHPPVAASLPVRVTLPGGRSLDGVTRELSQGGATILVARPDDAAEQVAIDFDLGDEPVTLAARVRHWDDRTLTVQWRPATVAEEAQVIDTVFGRADSWSDWAGFPADRPLVSLWRVLASIGGLFRPGERSAKPR